MDVTVQWIRTSWTKESRGGEAAARRNAVPVGFRVWLDTFDIAYGPVGADVFLSPPALLVDERGPVR
ncbi:hypothetical protein [Streptomyces sp. NPDC059894]|uniref:hypothetical protein n=1 Tax=unclassified Streptomyces TaxID=2593676 RepID=UPI0036539C27